jgi:hypothetical protein
MAIDLHNTETNPTNYPKPQEMRNRGDSAAAAGRLMATQTGGLVIRQDIWRRIVLNMKVVVASGIATTAAEFDYSIGATFFGAPPENSWFR